MKLYVGNLPWSTTDAELEELFAAIGPVDSARVITDRETGRSRGFGFVEMEPADADRAIAALDGTGRLAESAPETGSAAHRSYPATPSSSPRASGPRMRSAAW